MEKRVMIVEDESIISFGYRMQLESMGFNVMGVAKSAEEAKQIMEQERPDLLIMDIYLKGEKNGLDFVEDLHKKNDPIPAIFLTASNNVDMIHRIGSLNNCDYIPKPVSGSKLREALQKHAV